MATREIIKIDEEKCNGCGLCIPNCPEGALQIIDNKARLISDLFCDGLGACVGHCPEGAMMVEKREAAPYEEKKAMENIVKQGKNTIKAHLEHLKDHGATDYLKQAIEFLEENNIDNPMEETSMNQTSQCACPGAKTMEFNNEQEGSEEGDRPSHLKQWPVQLHLVSPMAPYFQGQDVLLAADCTAYALGDFHKNHMKGKSLAIACPKLDENQEVYVEKLTQMIDDSEINTLTVMTMEVPCCGGLLSIAEKAKEESKRKIPIKSIVVGIQGKVLSEDWL